MTYFKSNPKYRNIDALFKKILLRDRPHVCEWCGKTTEDLDGAHILPKGMYRKMRYVKENLLLLCRFCHRRWHDSPPDAMRFLDRYKGPEYYDSLKLKDRMRPHIPDLKLLKLAFKQELNTPTGGVER